MHVMKKKDTYETKKLSRLTYGSLRFTTYIFMKKHIKIQTNELF